MKLRRDMVSVNRALWALSAALAIASALLGGYWALELRIGSPQPLPLAAVA